MPFAEVKLIPGVNVERTPTLLAAGISQSQLIRFKDGLVQKYGGWIKYYTSAVPGIPRELHAWQDLNSVGHLGVGTTTQLGVITSGSYADVTPQQIKSDFRPIFQATSGSTTIGVTDPNIANVTTYDAIAFNTPISAGGVVLSGIYPIALVTGTTTYNITAQSAATATNTLATNAVTAAGNNTLNFAAVPAWVVAGMVIVDRTAPAVIPADTVVVSTTGTTIVMSNNAAGAGVGNGDSIVITSLPRFTTTINSAVVSVFLAAHGRAVNDSFVFPISTTVGGVIINGTFSVNSVPDANTVTITANVQASSSTTADMNSGSAELLYYISLGPAASGAGYGLGGYGSGGYGTGSSTTSQTGTEITATDWTMDNWGKLLLACPSGGAVYSDDPNGGFLTATFVSGAPALNGGIFISIAQQILICWASMIDYKATNSGIGIAQDPMLIKWSTSGDYTVFTPLTTNQAGSFRIPNGSTIKGGMATGTNRNLIWTDLDLWAMDYIGPPLVYSFNKIGSGAGLISAHAAQQLRGKVYWMGPSNFYSYPWSGDMVLPCPVWDFVFQNLNTSFVQNVRALPNTPFNEAGWAFPSSASVSGECDSYVKFNINEPNAPWDYGTLPRSAWIDQTAIGNPIAATSGGIIYQHETTNNADFGVLSSSFTSGYFYLTEGEEFVFVDQVYPDFKFGVYGGTQSAQVQISFNTVNYPSDTPVVYGPYTVTQATQYISTRFRCRQMSITVASNDVSSFWRLGKVRYRYSPAGRR